LGGNSETCVLNDEQKKKQRQKRRRPGWEGAWVEKRISPLRWQKAQALRLRSGLK
jgi:hypothetical protein